MNLRKLKNYFKLEIKPHQKEHFSNSTPINERALVLAKEVLSARVGVGLSLLFIISVVSAAIFLPIGENSLLNLQFQKRQSTAVGSAVINNFEAVTNFNGQDSAGQTVTNGCITTGPQAGTAAVKFLWSASNTTGTSLTWSTGRYPDPGTNMLPSQTDQVISGWNKNLVTSVLLTAFGDTIAERTIFFTTSSCDPVIPNPIPAITVDLNIATCDNCVYSNGPLTDSDNLFSLKWAVSNATSCTSSSSPPVSNWGGGTPSSNTLNVASGGAHSVSISSNTTFTLTCTNSAGTSRSDSVIANFTATPTAVNTVCATSITSRTVSVNKGSTTIVTFNPTGGAAPSGLRWAPSIRYASTEGGSYRAISSDGVSNSGLDLGGGLFVKTNHLRFNSFPLTGGLQFIFDATSYTPTVTGSYVLSNLLFLDEGNNSTIKLCSAAVNITVNPGLTPTSTPTTTATPTTAPDPVCVLNATLNTDRQVAVTGGTAVNFTLNTSSLGVANYSIGYTAGSNTKLFSTIGNRLNFDDGNADNLYITTTSSTFNSTTPNASRTFTFTINSDQNVTFGTYTLSNLFIEGGGKRINCLYPSGSSAAGQGGMVIKATPIFVTIQGRYVDPNGNLFTNNTLRVTLNNGSTTSNNINGTYFLNRQNPGTFTVTATNLAGYTVSYAYSSPFAPGTSCALPSSTAYRPGNVVTGVNLPSGGYCSDIYFKYTPSSTPTSTPTTTQTPTPTTNPAGVSCISTPANQTVSVNKGSTSTLTFNPSGPTTTTQRWAPAFRFDTTNTAISQDGISSAGYNLGSGSTSLLIKTNYLRFNTFPLNGGLKFTFDATNYTATTNGTFRVDNLLFLDEATNQIIKMCSNTVNITVVASTGGTPSPTTTVTSTPTTIPSTTICTINATLNSDDDIVVIGGTPVNFTISASGLGVGNYAVGYTSGSTNRPIGTRLNFDDGNPGNLYITTTSSTFNNTTPNSSRTFTFTINSDQNVTFGEYALDNLYLEVGGTKTNCLYPTGSGAAGQGGMVIKATPIFVTIQGRYVDPNGNLFTNNTLRVTLNNGSTTANNTTGSYFLNRQNPGTFTVTATPLAGHTISYTSSGPKSPGESCSVPSSASYQSGNVVTGLNLPSGGYCSDIYFKYTPTSTPTSTPTTPTPTINPTVTARCDINLSYTMAKGSIGQIRMTLSGSGKWVANLRFTDGGEKSLSTTPLDIGGGTTVYVDAISSAVLGSLTGGQQTIIILVNIPNSTALEVGGTYKFSNIFLSNGTQKINCDPEGEIVITLSAPIATSSGGTTPTTSPTSSITPTPAAISFAECFIQTAPFSITQGSVATLEVPVNNAQGQPLLKGSGEWYHAVRFYTGPDLKETVLSKKVSDIAIGENLRLATNSDRVIFPTSTPIIYTFRAGLDARLDTYKLANLVLYDSKDNSKEVNCTGELTITVTSRDLKPATSPVKSPFISGYDFNQQAIGSNGPYLHKGVDLKSRDGNLTIYSPYAGDAYVDGVVNDPYGNFTGYGNYIILKSMGDKYRTVFAHLQTMNVTHGEVIKPGQPIGVMGNTGFSSGIHLHYEVFENGIEVDPKGFGALEGSVPATPEPIKPPATDGIIFMEHEKGNLEPSEAGITATLKQNGGILKSTTILDESFPDLTYGPYVVEVATKAGVKVEYLNCPTPATCPAAYTTGKIVNVNLTATSHTPTLKFRYSITNQTSQTPSGGSGNSRDQGSSPDVSASNCSLSRNNFIVVGGTPTTFEIRGTNLPVGYVYVGWTFENKDTLFNDANNKLSFNDNDNPYISSALTYQYNSVDKASKNFGMTIYSNSQIPEGSYGVTNFYLSVNGKKVICSLEGQSIFSFTGERPASVQTPTEPVSTSCSFVGSSITSIDVTKGDSEGNGISFRVNGGPGPWAPGIVRVNGVREAVETAPGKTIVLASGQTGRDVTLTSLPTVFADANNQSVDFVIKADVNARVDSYIIRDLIVVHGPTSRPDTDINCTKTPSGLMITVKAPPPPPVTSTGAICPAECTKDHIQNYLINNFNSEYQEFLNVMINQESKYIWNVIADDGFNCPSSTPCYGTLQFMNSTWDTGPSLVGEKSRWSENDVYPNQSFAPGVPGYLTGSEASSNFPDNNIWNPFGQIEVTYQKLVKCQDREWPWMYKDFQMRAPGCG